MTLQNAEMGEWEGAGMLFIWGEYISFFVVVLVVAVVVLK